MRLKDVRDRVLDIILAEQKDKYSNPLEPFEVFSERLKKECQDRLDQYIEDLNSGYQSILKKIGSGKQ